MSRLQSPAASRTTLGQIDEFFMKTGPVQQTLRNLVVRLSEEKIDYAVIGGIELKLASGLSAEHRRLRDLADVQQLIETLDLSRDIALRLDESVRSEYLNLWQMAQQARAAERERT